MTDKAERVIFDESEWSPEVLALMKKPWTIEFQPYEDGGTSPGPRSWKGA